MSFGAKDLAGVARELLARLRQVDAAADPLEEGDPGEVLELLHLHRDRGLRHVERLGGAREGERARGAVEDLQLAQGHVPEGTHHLSLQYF